ncbi:hypothetical protein HMPREF0216_00312 [Clostridium celatum DSM 1785]|uniref:Heme-binding protein n=1 Tax=Clostridium celatum DSM 1785 TaxID=545697 RepID=L1QMP7_9CLOT|nr:hypothetical protein HMPREF0216_00312 [Clostridium celatum DSM 1785]
MIDLNENKYLNLKIATHVIEAVQQIANNYGTPVVIAIANEWGTPIAIHFMDEALPASFDIALNKAYTSATVRLSTEEIRELSRDGGELFGINNSNNNKIVSFPGGFTLKINEKVVGGVGVSGGTAKYDNELAFLAKEIYGEVIKWMITQN